MLKINERIEKWLKFNNITQVEFAKNIGVTKATVNQWVKGYTKPTPTNEKTIALSYPELNIYWLWGKEENITREVILKPIDKISYENLIAENTHLQDKVTYQDKLIASLSEQIDMYKFRLKEKY